MNNKAFTLVELLIVIGIIMILSASVIISINPGLQMREARNNQREAHLSALYGAFMEYNSREGDWPPCVSSSSTDVHYCDEITPDFINEVPEDPDSDCEEITGYFVKESFEGRIGLRAECTEGGGSKIKVGTWD